MNLTVQNQHQHLRQLLFWLECVQLGRWTTRVYEFSYRYCFTFFEDNTWFENVNMMVIYSPIPFCLYECISKGGFNHYFKKYFLGTCRRLVFVNEKNKNLRICKIRFYENTLEWQVLCCRIDWFFACFCLFVCWCVGVCLFVCLFVFAKKKWVVSLLQIYRNTLGKFLFIGMSIVKLSQWNAQIFMNILLEQMHFILAN